ncbi:MAG: prenyltransferase [Bacteroidaceae bacterium]|nr:prenyltransferase [Bacteroidaceae bacterium]
MKKHSVKEWILATRPWSFPASAMPVMVTIAWSWAKGYDVNWCFALWALVNIVIVHAAGNVWSDIADYRSGVDAKDTFGVQSLVDGQFTVAEFKRLSITLNIIAVAAGLALVALTGLPLLYIGVAGILLSLCYPRLKYKALGDLVIICCYALLPMTGTSFIATGAIRWEVLWLAVPVGLITVGILHANNVRDIETDQRAGITTFPLLTGRRFGAALYAIEVILPFLWLVGLMIARVEPWWLGTAFLAMPVAVKNARTMLAYEQGGKESYAALDEKTAQLQLLFSLLLILGLVLSRLL